MGGVGPTMGSGCASVLKSTSLSGSTSSSPKSRKRYLRVSPRKNVSILSREGGGMTVTSDREV